MRRAHHKEQFTPFGIWIQEYLPDSKEGLCVTNLDFIFEDFKRKRIMLVEEKQNNGVLANGQRKTFQIFDQFLKECAHLFGYQYCGFYVLKFPAGCSMPGPGMTLNDKEITSEQLRDHLAFKKRFCDPFWPIGAARTEAKVV